MYIKATAEYTGTLIDYYYYYYYYTSKPEYTFAISRGRSYGLWLVEELV